LGDPQCVVRVQVHRVGDAPPDCPDCLWSHSVQRSEPEVLTNIDDACSKSELALDAAAVAALADEVLDYGYVHEYTGHNDVLMGYDTTDLWKARHFAQWSEDSGELVFDRRDGFCNY